MDTRFWISFYILLGLLCWFFWFTKIANANSSSNIIISEIHPAPNSGTEWVEIQNVGTTAVSLNDWQLFDQLSSPSLLHQFSNTSINPGEFLVVEVGSKLNNSGDGVELKNAEGQLIDTLAFSGTQTGMSWARFSNSGDDEFQTPTKGAVNQAAPTPSPTPVVTPTPSPTSSPSPSPTTTPQPSVTPSPTPNPSSLPTLMVSEIMACPPSGEQEWLEIYNPSNNTVSVQNWKVSDTGGTVKTITGTLLPFQFTVLSWSGSLLNNSGDSFKLTTDSNVVISQGELDACSSGQSWVWKNGNWEATENPTPGSNPVSTATTDQTVSEIQDIQNVDVSDVLDSGTSSLGSSDYLTTPSSFQRLPFSNNELALMAPRLIESVEPQNSYSESLTFPNTTRPSMPWWVTLWLWGGILMGGCLSAGCTAFLWWRTQQKHHQEQLSPPHPESGSSPFKWELG